MFENSITIIDSWAHPDHDKELSRWAAVVNYPQAVCPITFTANDVAQNDWEELKTNILSSVMDIYDDALEEARKQLKEKVDELEN